MMLDFVLPAYFPSISMSASVGVLVIVTLAFTGASVLFAEVAFGGGLVDELVVGADLGGGAEPTPDAWLAWLAWLASPAITC